MIHTDDYHYDVTEYGRRQRGVYQVARLDGPTAARLDGQSVQVIALDWNEAGTTQMACLADGRRVALHRLVIDERSTT